MSRPSTEEVASANGFLGRSLPQSSVGLAITGANSCNESACARIPTLAFATTAESFVQNGALVSKAALYL
jgi:hypothetical protein